jgi:pimeloyl-ACP methyl ester carboxylesterase
LAHRHPDLVSGLVLEGGYFYPSVRLDVIPLSLPAIPLMGDVLRHTVSPLLSRLVWPLLMRKIFGPQAVPEKFRGFPREMALRPSQLRASAEETAMMVPSAWAARGRYADLHVPVAIIAGEGDRMVATARQSARLQEEIGHSTFTCVPDTGHMVHHTATGDVLDALEQMTQRQLPPCRTHVLST